MGLGLDLEIFECVVGFEAFEEVEGVLVDLVGLDFVLLLEVLSKVHEAAVIVESDLGVEFLAEL